jgi:hypothetical protein
MSSSKGQPTSGRRAILTMREEPPIYVQDWLEDAKRAYQQGNLEAALLMQRKVVTWTEINLVENHPFRGSASLNLGLLLI